MAATLHNFSPRRDRTMVKVNCAALPASLIESELFGREKGAYTGALSKQIGRFELAHNSTIFLDEVGDLPPEVQVKLLRVLQEGQLEHLGNPQPIRVNVRVVAATNRDLVAAGARRPVPRRPLLSDQRLPDHRAAAARTPTGHPAARVGLRRGVLQDDGQDRPGRRQGEHGDAGGLPVAGQHP